MATSKSTHTDDAGAPPAKAAEAAELHAATARPAFEDAPPAVAGAGQVVVESPTGIRSVVSEDAVDGLKPQGYKVV